jgi:integrase/recombinase XerD
LPNTHAKEVNLTKRVQTTKGPRYCAVVLSSNGRVKPDLVTVNGQQERHPEGAYYLEWRENSRRVRLSVGKDPADASARRLRKEAELNAVNNGVAVVPENSDHGHRSLTAAVAEFLEETKLTKKPKTLAAYSTSLMYFQESCSKLYLEDIERRDLLKFSAFLRDEKEQAPRSCWNKFCKRDVFPEDERHSWVGEEERLAAITEEEPEMYEQAELDDLFKACDMEERLWFEFFLMTGMREQEVMHTYWSDVNFTASTVRVSHKPDHGWTPKAYKEREIPIPAKLVKGLKMLKKKF